jgi:nucleotide-binding universal stress UspA family protein
MKIIVPIENAQGSQQLFDVLMGMKWRAGTQIVLITVLPKWVNGPDASASIPNCLREIESLAIELRSVLPTCEVSFFVREGHPKIEIPSFARVSGADLIVLSPVDSENPAHLGVESVSASILSHAHCPVLVVKPSHDGVDNAQAGFHNVLIPMDDTVYADLALKWLLNFQWSSQTRFVLCSIIEHDSAKAVASDSLLRRAQLVSTLLNTRNVFIEVRTDNPTQGIIRLAQEAEADLIVIGSHARVGIQRIIFGSVSEKVARKGSCSIAIIRGIAQADYSWHRTGVFKEQKLPNFEMNGSYRRYDDSQDNNVSPHVVPSGMR